MMVTMAMAMIMTIAIVPRFLQFVEGIVELGQFLTDGTVIGHSSELGQFRGLLFQLLEFVFHFVGIHLFRKSAIRSIFQQPLQAHPPLFWPVRDRPNP